jgi:hypothetical protein
LAGASQVIGDMTTRALIIVDVRQPMIALRAVGFYVAE